MALENMVGTDKFINALVNSNPVNSDPKSEGAAHLRGIKNVLFNCFEFITGKVTATHTEINRIADGILATAAEVNAICDGKTLTSTDDKIDNFPVNTDMLFYQAAAPTGWTKQTSQNDKALRIVSGTGGVAGGTVGFSTVFGRTATDSHTLTTTEMPSHNHGGVSGSAGAHVHNLSTPSGAYNTSGISVAITNVPYSTKDNTAAGHVSSEGAHTHSVSAQGGGGGHSHNIDLRVQYIDVIRCRKN